MSLVTRRYPIRVRAHCNDSLSTRWPFGARSGAPVHPCLIVFTDCRPARFTRDILCEWQAGLPAVHVWLQIDAAEHHDLTSPSGCHRPAWRPSLTTPREVVNSKCSPVRSGCHRRRGDGRDQEPLGRHLRLDDRELTLGNAEARRARAARSSSLDRGGFLPSVSPPACPFSISRVPARARERRRHGRHGLLFDGFATAGSRLGPIRTTGASLSSQSRAQGVVRFVSDQSLRQCGARAGGHAAPRPGSSPSPLELPASQPAVVVVTPMSCSPLLHLPSGPVGGPVGIIVG